MGEKKEKEKNDAMFRVVFVLELMVQANVSLAKEGKLMEYFVILMDVTKSNCNFIQSNYPF